MVAEVVGGLLTGSLALLADAGHMLSDVAALGLSVVAIGMAQRPSSPQQTYGYLRTEILAALAHGALLVGVAIFVAVEAVERLDSPQDVLAAPMFAIATGGLAVNLLGLAILNAGKKENLNIRGAWLHVLSDALGSVGAMAAGLCIWAWGWIWADAVASILISALITYSAWALLREVVGVLMESAPPHIDVGEVEASITELPGVAAVHDLHVWTITSGMVSLSGHVVAADGQRGEDLLHRISAVLRQRFEITHTTIQVEPKGFEEPGAICPP